MKEQVQALVAFLQVQARRKSTGCPRWRRPSTSCSSATRARARRRWRGSWRRCTGRSACSQKGHLVEVDRAEPGRAVRRRDRDQDRPRDPAGARRRPVHRRGLLAGAAGSARLDFGPEAVEILLKRMEDHRHRLVVIVAGYPRLMDRSSTRTPACAPGSPARSSFPDYSTDELDAISRTSWPSTSTRWSPAPKRRCAASSTASARRGLRQRALRPHAVRAGAQPPGAAADPRGDDTRPCRAGRAPAPLGRGLRRGRQGAR